MFLDSITYLLWYVGLRDMFCLQKKCLDRWQNSDWYYTSTTRDFYLTITNYIIRIFRELVNPNKLLPKRLRGTYFEVVLVFGPELIMFRTITFFNYSESQLLRDFQPPTWSCIVICDCIKSSQFRSLLCTQSFEHSNVYCHKCLQLTIKLSSNGITKIFWTQLANFIQIQI